MKILTEWYFPSRIHPTQKKFKRTRQFVICSKHDKKDGQSTVATTVVLYCAYTHECFKAYNTKKNCEIMVKCVQYLKSRDCRKLICSMLLPTIKQIKIIPLKNACNFSPCLSKI